MPAPLQRILYVDDEPHIRDLARISLEKVGGFTTCICDSGRAAIKAAPDFAPDLILLDVMMPDMDGPQTLEALRRCPGLERVPVVFVTAKARSTEVERYISLGATSVVSKPFSPLELPTTLKSIWNGLH